MAALALADVGSHLTEVGTDESGAPIWPMGTVGSIAHSAGVAAAVVADAEHWRSIGIDVERTASPDTARRIELVCMCRDELAFAAPLPATERCQYATALFACKEALYKCLFPLVRVWFDFTDALCSACDLAAGRLDLVVLRDLGYDAVRRGTIYAATFRFHQGIIFAAVQVPIAGYAAIVAPDRN